MGAQQGSGRFRLPDGSRSAQSVWVWRGLLFMSLIAVGIGIGVLEGNAKSHTTYGILWFVIAAGWFAISMWLWRRHVLWDNSAQVQARPAKGAARGSSTGTQKPVGKRSTKRAR